MLTISNIESVNPIDPVTKLRLKDITMYNKINELANVPNAIILTNVIAFDAQIDGEGKVMKYYVGCSGDDLYYTSSEICYNDMYEILESFRVLDGTPIPVVKFCAIPNKRRTTNNPTLKCVIMSACKTYEEAQARIKEIIGIDGAWEAARN